MKRLTTLLPLILAATLVAGIYLGLLLNPNTDQSTSKTDKLSNILEYIAHAYVDSVDIQKINDYTIPLILQQLDPHSSYVTKEEFTKNDDPLLGKFDGIGVQFRIEKDTVVVIQPIAGGPSEQAGIRAGDRIVIAGEDTIAGKKLTTTDVMSVLKGSSGTSVDLKIFRRGSDKLLPFTIIRDAIPTWSIDIAYMVNDTIGYIKLGKFSATTDQEFKQSVKELKNRGMKNLVFDLRGNKGGYLHEARAIADEFLPESALIVYTEGENQAKELLFASSNGEAEEMPLIILIDESSASASEIVAGAIQDNDRGTIIGRRSFGKGLVQEPLLLSDSSLIRLTIARYYTPTGRSIQKPYGDDDENYYSEIYNRYQNGEMLSADSTHFNDSLKFTTPGGKVVYGGGGIMPDIFVPLESGKEFIYYNKLSNRGLIFTFAFNYTDSNRESLKKYETVEQFISDFKITPSIWNAFVKEVKASGVSTTDSGLTDNKSRINIMLKAYIGRNLFNEAGFYPIYHKKDPAFLKAIDLFASENQNP